MKNPTTGQTLATTLRHYFSVSPTTSRNRKQADLHQDMVEAIIHAATLPGYFSPNTETALRVGFGAALSYDKHIRGFRVSGTTIYQISRLSPWQFAALLGRAVDAGVTNTGEGEQFFRNWGAN